MTHLAPQRHTSPVRAHSSVPACATSTTSRVAHQNHSSEMTMRESVSRHYIHHMELLLVFPKKENPIAKIHFRFHCTLLNILARLPETKRKCVFGKTSPLSTSSHANGTLGLYAGSLHTEHTKIRSIVILKGSGACPTVYKDRFQGKPWKVKCIPSARSSDEELSTGEKGRKTKRKQLVKCVTRWPGGQC